MVTWDLPRLIPAVIWTALAIYGIYIQSKAWDYAHQSFKVAKPFGDFNSIMVMAHARYRSNTVRMSVVLVNFLIGIITLAQILFLHVQMSSPNGALTILGYVVAFGFVVNEIALLVVATLEVRAHKRLVRQFKS